MKKTKAQQDLKAADTGNRIDATLLKLARDLGQEIHLRPAVLEALSLNSSLDRDLGLDSLTRMELLSRIEREMRVRLPESVFSEISTLDDIKRYKATNFEDFPECFGHEDWKVTFFHNEEINQIVREQMSS